MNILLQFAKAETKTPKNRLCFYLFILLAQTCSKSGFHFVLTNNDCMYECTCCLFVVFLICVLGAKSIVFYRGIGKLYECLALFVVLHIEFVVRRFRKKSLYLSSLT